MDSLRNACRAAALILLCLPASLFAQADSNVPVSDAKATTLSMDARLVTMPVVVRDKKGALIQNLTKDDFVLQIDGKPQAVRYFDHDANLPLTFGLLVDTSMSQRDVLDDERTASSTFLEQMLAAKQDRAFVIQFAHQTELLQDITDSKPKLQAALKDLDSAAPARNSDDTDNEGRRVRNAGTVLYDATFLASDEVMKKQKGRKAMILLTDGADRGSKESLTSAIEAAQRSDTTLYAIYFKGEEHHQDDNRGNRGGGFPGGRGGGFPGGGGGGYPGGGGGQGGGGRGGQGGGRPSERANVDGKKILERMTSETGGRLFEVTKKQTVADIYKQIGEELRAQYRLGYTPDADHAAEGYHQIDLTLKADPKGDKDKRIIQTRDGYYTGAAK